MDDQSNAVDILRAMPVFALAPAAVVQELEAIAKVLHVAQGTLIFSEGDTHTDLYFVSCGTIVLDMNTAKCGKQQILTVGDGDLLAWSAFLSDGHMTASAVATQDSRLVAFAANELRDLCDANHDVGYVVTMGIALLMSRRLLATRLQLLDLFHL